MQEILNKKDMKMIMKIIMISNPINHTIEVIELVGKEGIIEIIGIIVIIKTMEVKIKIEGKIRRNLM